MWEFLSAGGPFMVPLVVTSLIAVAFIIERGIALRWKKVVPREVERGVERCDSPQRLAELKVTCQNFPSALSRLLLVAMNHLYWPLEENADAVETRARHEIGQLERWLVVLEIITGIAPLLGLVGTIHGLSTLFSDLGQKGLSETANFARGIAITLNTTLMGLLIAIPALIAWSYYTKKVETLAVEMETLCDEFLRKQYRQRSEQTEAELKPMPAPVEQKEPVVEQKDPAVL